MGLRHVTFAVLSLRAKGSAAAGKVGDRRPPADWMRKTVHADNAGSEVWFP